MLNQTFDVNSLLKLTTKREIIAYKLGKNQADYIASLEKISFNINKDDFTFTSLNKFEYNGREIYKTEFADEHYALQKITDNIKRIYKIKFSNKEEIINQTINLLCDTSSYNIFRLDVKDFFENINFKQLIHKLESDNVLSKSSLNILKKLRNLLPTTLNGIPRGLAISSVLSELFMEEIDNVIRSIKEVYFYARYVDDIIIISHSNTLNMDFLKAIFNSKGLNLNAKSTHLKVPEINKSDTLLEFSFLGYVYQLYNDVQSDGSRKITIDISTKKTNKIKTRIVKSILSFTHNRDEVLLMNRIKFLSGNYTVRIDKNNKKIYSEVDSSALKGGIYYNNKFINSQYNLSCLNIYLRKLLLCKKKNSIGKAVATIPIELRRKLISHCFISGHRRAIFHKFTNEEIANIKKCWE